LLRRTTSKPHPIWVHKVSGVGIGGESLHFLRWIAVAASLMTLGIAMFDVFKGWVVLLYDLFVTHNCLRFENQTVPASTRR
jgi:hypothetical protein